MHNVPGKWEEFFGDRICTQPSCQVWGRWSKKSLPPKTCLNTLRDEKRHPGATVQIAHTTPPQPTETIAVRNPLLPPRSERRAKDERERRSINHHHQLHSQCRRLRTNRSKRHSQQQRHNEAREEGGGKEGSFSKITPLTPSSSSSLPHSLHTGKKKKKRMRSLKL